MNSRIPGSGSRVEILVALGSRSSTLLAKENALADLATKLDEANQRLEAAQAARKAARVARFGARRDRDLANRSLVAVARGIHYATLAEWGGARSNAAYRALFPNGLAGLVNGPPGQRMAALTALETLLQGDPAQSQPAKRLADAMAAWKVAVDAEVAAHATEALAMHALRVAREDWVAEYTAARSTTAAWLRSVQAAKEYFPTSVRKADGEEDSQAVTPAGDAPATAAPKPVAA